MLRGRFPSSHTTSPSSAGYDRDWELIRIGAGLAFVSGGGTVTQRCIEMVIGRLVDAEFRDTFFSHPHPALGALLERGTHLTHAEIGELIALESTLWGCAREHVDP